MCVNTVTPLEMHPSCQSCGVGEMHQSDHNATRWIGPLLPCCGATETASTQRQRRRTLASLEQQWADTVCGPPSPRGRVSFDCCVVLGVRSLSRCYHRSQLEENGPHQLGLFGLSMGERGVHKVIRGGGGGERSFVPGFFAK